ncbi:MAG: hypothetical protein ACKVOR_10875 [Flavobacteriales bacterium]
MKGSRGVKKTLMWCLLLMPAITHAQYEDNPLNGLRWATLSAGANTADNISWQACAAASIRGSTMLTQLRVAYSQELIEAPDDTCTAMKNKITEIGILWGDGFGGRHWFVTGTLGFGLNVRTYCARAEYGGFRSVTAVTIGIPAHIEAGIMLDKKSAITMSIIGNWNFRQPYAGALLGYTRRF